MGTLFKKLCSVSFNHDYFAEGMTDQLSMVPTSETVQKMKDLGLLFRRSKNTFSVFYEAHEVEESKPLKLTNENDKLIFLIKQEDYLFQNYTALPVDLKYPSLLYFSNLSSATGDKGELLLSQGDFADATDVLYLRKAIVNVAGESEADDVEVLLKNEQGETIVSQTAEVADGAYTTQLDLLSYPKGKYQLSHGSEEQAIYVNNDIHHMPVLAVVEIFLGYEGKVPVDRQLLDGDEVDSKAYVVQFGARETHWKYIVVLKNFNDEDDLEIQYSDDALEESSPYPEEMTFLSKTPDDGLLELYGEEKVLLFESEDPIPFYSSPMMGVNLMKEAASLEDEEETTYTEVLKNLPNPPVSLIKPQVGEEVTYYTETFIYI